MRKTLEVIEGPVPVAATEVGLRWLRDVRWQVICGDDGHWRAGIYAPPEATCGEVVRFERHDCPELFVLLEGRMTLVFEGADQALHELPLEAGVPVLMERAHGAYCPDGPHTGVALVVERPAFVTRFSDAHPPAPTD